MSLQTSKAFEVAIVGGGVCGLTCAIALARRGVPVQVYEAAARFSEIGAGLGLGNNAMRILKGLGLADDLKKKAGLTAEQERETQAKWFRFHSGGDGHELIYEYVAPGQESRLGLHRAAFLDVLVTHIDPSCAHFNKRCVNVGPSDTDPEKSKISFADGTYALADVVLGADGIKSVVRGAVTGHDPTANLSFGNTVCYRGLVPVAAAEVAGVTRDYSIHPVCYVGQSKHVIVFAISGNTLINVVAFSAKYDVAIGEVKLPPNAPAVERVTTEELLKLYEGWGSEVVALLGCIKEPSKWTINVVYPSLKSYASGRVAVLGDAAHGMLPHLGAGAGQGIEDAEMLARLLSHPHTTAENLDQVLKVYDEIRRPRAQSVWEGSVQAGKTFDGHGKSGASAEGLRKDLPGRWDFLWRHNFDEDEERALDILHKRGIFSPLV